MMRSAFAAFAIPVLRHLIAQRVRAQMSDLAEKIDRGFGIAILQLAVRRAHAAKGLNLAPITDRGTRTWLVPNLSQRTIPAFKEAALSNVGALLVRDHANAHQAV